MRKIGLLIMLAILLGACGVEPKSKDSIIQKPSTPAIANKSDNQTSYSVNYSNWKEDFIINKNNKIKLIYLIPVTYKIDKKLNDTSSSFVLLKDINTQGEKKILFVYASNKFNNSINSTNHVYELELNQIKTFFPINSTDISGPTDITINNAAYTYFYNPKGSFHVYFKKIDKNMYYIATNSDFKQQTYGFIDKIKTEIPTNTEIANANSIQTLPLSKTVSTKSDENITKATSIESIAANSQKSENNVTNKSVDNFKTYPKTFQEQVEYVGNSKTMKFHVKTCDSVDKIAPGNVVMLKSIDIALSRGYSPCKRCNPHK